jgi:hypothetical protein
MKAYSTITLHSTRKKPLWKCSAASGERTRDFALSLRKDNFTNKLWMVRLKSRADLLENLPLRPMNRWRIFLVTSIIIGLMYLSKSISSMSSRLRYSDLILVPQKIRSKLTYNTLSVVSMKYSILQKIILIQVEKFINSKWQGRLYLDCPLALLYWGRSEKALKVTVRTVQDHKVAIKKVKLPKI